MASFNKVNGFSEHLTEKEHNLGADQLVIALSNTAPGSESTPPSGATGAAVIANVTQISYTNCSTRNITTSASAQSSGTYKLTLTDLVLTASGGTVGPFRYAYIFNDTSTSDKIVGYYDYGSSVTLNDTETFTFDFDGSAGALTLA